MLSEKVRRHGEADLSQNDEVNEMSKIKQVLVIRKDLKMRKGKMIAQGAHACLSAIIDTATKGKYDKWAQDWYENGMTKIAVSVDSEEELIEIYQAARTKMPSSLITDRGTTEFHGEPTQTAVAIGPAPADMVDKITGDLKLL